MGHQALTAPFILYEIFLHLPQHDLLLIQRVCRTWHDVINSSKVLLAALFLHPGPTTSVPLSAQLNPLLQSRFPSFFGNSLLNTSSRLSEHCMGPWYTTHWAENIRPWGGGIFYRNRDPRPPIIESPELDLHRTAAYKRPEASWRRMIPCMPAPIELQVRCEYKTNLPPRRSTLRSLNFGKDGSKLKETNSQCIEDESSERPWLTFGLVYEIVAAAWFRGVPTPANVVQFDYTFQDARLPIGQTRLPWDTDHDYKIYHRLYHAREELRDLLPQKKVGGPGRLFIVLIGHSRGAGTVKRYKNEFDLQSTTTHRLV